MTEKKNQTATLLTSLGGVGTLLVGIAAIVALTQQKAPPTGPKTPGSEAPAPLDDPSRKAGAKTVAIRFMEALLERDARTAISLLDDSVYYQRAFQSRSAVASSIGVLTTRARGNTPRSKITQVTTYLPAEVTGELSELVKVMELQENDVLVVLTLGRQHKHIVAVRRVDGTMRVVGHAS